MTYEEYCINHRYEMALRNLAKGWQELSLAERLENLQAIEDKLAQETGRIPAEIVSRPLEEGCAAMQVGNTIIISEKELMNADYKSVVNSVYHEASHVLEFQGAVFTKVGVQLSPQELAARNTPIPNPKSDYEGYLNHPAEVAAREAGAAGVERTLSEQEQIAKVDNEMHQPGNQILVTYDYLALDGNVEAGANVGPEYDLGVDNGFDAGIDAAGIDDND